MLTGKIILIVEDEALLALDLAFVMQDMGADVVGPCYRLNAAIETAREIRVDGAILDGDLAGEAVFPLADELAKANVPFVLHTGRQNAEELTRRYQRARVCPKPTPPDRVARELFAMITAAE